MELQSSVLQNKCHNLKMFSCADCELTFTQKRLLKAHVKIHLKKPLHTFGNRNSSAKKKCKENNLNMCHICDKKFSRFNGLKIHLLNHDGISYKCAYCKKYFVSQVSLDKHCCKVLSKTKFEERGFNNYDLLNSLKLGKKSNKKRKNPEYIKNIKDKCDICGKVFIKFLTLKIHILNVHQGINYQCEICSKKFPCEKDLIIHMSKQDCKAEDLWMCNTCGKIFAKKDYLKKHQYMHMNNLFKCKYCYCSFMKEKSYKKHVEKMNCSKSARNIKIAEYNYKKCRICDSEYETEELLIKHFKTSHIDLEPHQCFYCEACLPTFKDLQNHIHHHNIQKFTCNLCGKAYTSQEGFRKHRIKHKGAEFKCKFCSSEFLKESRYRFHEKTCKRNPENGYDNSDDRNAQNAKDKRPKQSRQLNWESRIIVKHLREDPKSLAKNQKDGLVVKQENALSSTFFDDSESESSNEKGWFDKYYKTEEDDIAFGVKKGDGKELTDFDSDFDSSEILSHYLKKKTLNSPSALDSNKAKDSGTNAGNYSSDSSSGPFSSSSDEESENTVLAFEYNPKKCRICLINFSHEYELLHHFIKAHPNENAHQCPHCEVKSPLFAQLKEHMKCHGIGVGVYNCDNCSKQFKNEKKMKIHKIRCKGINNELETSHKVPLSQTNESRCKRCGKNFYTKFGYRRHKQFCKKEIKNKNLEHSSSSPVEELKDGANDAVLHLSDLEEKVPESTISEKCSLFKKEDVITAKSNSQELVKSEKAAKTENNTVCLVEPPADSFPCRLCDKKFQYERGLVMHFKAAHPGNKPIVCHVCNMHLADKLKEHLKTHGIGEEFVCELCGKRFNQKFLSKIHEMWHQGIEYKCTNCKQKFLNKDKMDKHIQENRCSNRLSLMRLPCDICGKSYRSKFGLSKHYITHTPKELRPVKNRMNCEYCGKWFESNNGLQRHRRIHTGERPFCCRFCPKAFAQEGNCKAHEKIHTGESRPRKKKSPPGPTSAVTTQPPPPTLPTQLSFSTVITQIQPSSVTLIPPPPPSLAHQISILTAEDNKYPINVFIHNTIDNGIVN